MIAIIQEHFEHNTANIITRFLEHPTAPMIRRFSEYTENMGGHRTSCVYKKNKNDLKKYGLNYIREDDSHNSRSI